MATPGIAAGAYARAAQLANPGAGVTRAIGGAGGDEQGQSFGSVLKDALAAVRQSGVKSDAQTQAMVTSNKANIVDVVTAVAETEAAVNTLVSVRDKVIAAYEQIMQMPI
jgi:flagellar hook-basal body complex protein FliE